MPWKETCPMDQRLDFVIEHRSSELSLAALCRVYGISRQTGYKWIERFSLRDGLASLQERSRRPYHSANKTSVWVEAKLVARRKDHPTWGARKLLWLLQKQWPKKPWPAPSTATEILKRHGLVRSRKRRPPLAFRTQPFSHCTGPNDVWCVDFKGQFRTADGKLVYPLTVMDGASRYLLACDAFVAPESEPTRKTFERLFCRHGLPKAIRSDNGEPFASVQSPAGLSRLSAWWTQLGIRVERIDPGEPQQNGRHERMHLTLKIDTASPPKDDLHQQRKAFDAFRRSYNHHRPHEALGMQTPAALYRSSQRRMPSKPPKPQYPFADLCVVDSAGYMRWGFKKYFISASLAGHTLGAYFLDAQHLEVRFCNVLIGMLDLSNTGRGLIRIKPPRKPKVSAMSPV
ncbi:MAG: integrase core domain-containing protein [Acidobacteriaceae bacterium]